MDEYKWPTANDTWSGRIVYYLSIGLSNYTSLNTSFHTWSKHYNCGRMPCHIHLLSAVEGLVYLTAFSIKQILTYIDVLNHRTVHFPCQAEWLATSVSCNILQTCRKQHRVKLCKLQHAILQYTTNDLLFLKPKLTSAAMWFAEHITVCEMMPLKIILFTKFMVVLHCICADTSSHFSFN